MGKLGKVGHSKNIQSPISASCIDHIAGEGHGVVIVKHCIEFKWKFTSIEQHCTGACCLP